jgi:hypothetical protein
MDGLAASIGADKAALAALARTVQRLAPRWFVIRDAHVNNGIALLQPRWAMSLLRGPMTRTELKKARTEHARVIGTPDPAPNEPPPPPPPLPGLATPAKPAVAAKQSATL